MPKIQMRRDTAANWKTVNPTLLSGEWALETDTKKMKIGDGNTVYNTLEYFREEDNQWQKPADWMDIRSGALPNSVYFLVAHSADYSTYPIFGVNARVSNSGTYDVFVDGVKQATTDNNTATTLDWQTLALTTGYDVTYPASLRTHIVRITPTDPTNTITGVMQSASATGNFGTLWIHFTGNNGYRLLGLCSSSSTSAIITSPVLEAITTTQESLKIDYAGAAASMEKAFYNCPSLKELPVLDMGDALSIKNTFYNCSSLKTIKIKNYNGTGYTSETAFGNDTALKKIETENSIISLSYRTFRNCPNLKSITNTLFDFSSGNAIREFFAGCSSLDPISLDLSNASNITRFTVGGTSTIPVPGVRGVVVSSSAPFDNATSPQLDVSYTGMDRAALVNLFNSMPTVSDSQVCDVTGCTGAVDLTPEDLAIATAKGWTVTR